MPPLTAKCDSNEEPGEILFENLPDKTRRCPVGLSVMFSCFIFIITFKVFYHTKEKLLRSTCTVCRSKKRSRTMVPLNEIKVKSAEMNVKNMYIYILYTVYVYFFVL